jgi:adenosylcobalamin-dependent ribonucleoside-triphosphate reductase
MTLPSTRAAIVEARTYLRPTNDDATEFETREQAADRIIGHQRWLWERAKGGMKRIKHLKDLPPVHFNDALGYRVDDGWILVPLTAAEEAELQELRQLFLDRKVTFSGRTRWLGGTDIGKQVESTQFNCCFLEVRSIHDVVDHLWLLLQGCGVGFRPVVGSLNGFSRQMDVKIIRSTRSKDEKGRETNRETFKDGVWTIQIGDSAVAWAKSIGKIMAGKYTAHTLVLDFSQIRGPGGRLKNYGWISSGDEQISIAYKKIAEIMNNRAGQLLTRIDLLDIGDHLGTILSSRRSAEIAVMAYGEPEWEEFAEAKKDHYARGLPHRAMSNNSLMFYQKPTRYQLKRLFKMMVDSGGSEPGFINAAAALKRAPWFKGVNPCAEILLTDKGFCNLVETVLFRFNGDEVGLQRAHYLVTRANYRQTCVNFEDGILQRTWHENNEFLRLCGAGVTGVVSWEHVNEPEAWKDLYLWAWSGAQSMADELGMPRAKAVTTIKPSGTQSKAMGTVDGEVPEGIHKPLGRYIFNNINFSKHDPIVGKLQTANYHTFENPYDPTGVVVRIPAEFKNITFDVVEMNGKKVEVNLETAIDQLERYKLVMENYVDFNASITVSYSVDEIPAIIDWLLENWDSYVAVSFLFRNDPTKTAADLGYPYLPQEVVDEDTFRAYATTLLPVDLANAASMEIVEGTEACINGVCPIR